MSFWRFLEFSLSMALSSRPVALSVKRGQLKKEPKRRRASEKRVGELPSISK